MSLTDNIDEIINELQDTILYAYGMGKEEQTIPEENIAPMAPEENLEPDQYFSLANDLAELKETKAFG